MAMDDKIFNFSLTEKISELTQESLNIIFPNQCVFCGQICKKEPGFPRICRSCLTIIPFRKQQDMEIAWLDDSAMNIVNAGKIYCATWYRDPVRSAILRMKFTDSSETADALAAILIQCWRTTGLDCQAVVAVPLHKSRQRERGYNQAGLLAERVAGKLGRPDWSDCLVRSKKTSRQSSLADPMSRKINMADAFQLDPGFFVCRNVFQHQKYAAPIILIDDVLTTGATLNEAAKPLRAAGYSVFGLVVSSAHPPGTALKCICGY